MADTFEERDFKIPAVCAGNDCARCNIKLKDGLEQVKGVQDARLDGATSTLTLAFDPNVVSFDSLERKARELGCALAEQFGHETLTLTGLDCADCAIKLEKAVGRLPGVVWVGANFAGSKLSVEYEADKVELKQVVQIINNLGYGVEEAGPPPAGEAFWRRHPKAVSTGLSGLFLLLGFITERIGLSPLAAHILYTVSILSGGYYVARSGFYSLKMLSFDMNFLVTAAVIGAMVIGEWLDGAMVVFLFAVGTAMESYSMERTRRVIRGLVTLSPREARIRHHDHEETVAIDRIKIGDVMIVRPGEKIAMDGIVAVGASSVDQASITGESIPVDKVPGDRVFAGAINQYGAMEVEVTHIAADNTIAKITHMVEEAQAHKAPTQVFTEKFGRYYTPIVMLLAAAVAVIPPLVLGAPFSGWLHRALILLVVACPCSLIISTPVALVSAIGNAAKSGVLVKGGAYLEAAGSLSVFAFDKTGTLTTGRPEVTDVIPLSGLKEDDILALTAAVESRSEHPVAHAIVRAAKERGLDTPKIMDFQAVPGSGAYARLGEDLYFVGSWKFFEERLLPLEAKPDLLHLEESGKTVIFLGSEIQLIGAVALADKVRPQAAEAVKALRRLGLKHIVMLTGDNAPTAGLIAAAAGVDAFHAELMPEDKVELIVNLKQRHEGVAMVGDGVNDAPALAAATIGIAMGAAGSDVALETADIALMSDDITKLAYTVDLSRRAMRVIKQNIIFSLAVVAVLMVATLSGHINLTIGIIGHEGSALAVIFNGMRLLKR